MITALFTRLGSVITTIIFMTLVVIAYTIYARSVGQRLEQAKQESQQLETLQDEFQKTIEAKQIDNAIRLDSADDDAEWLRDNEFFRD